MGYKKEAENVEIMHDGTNVGSKLRHAELELYGRKLADIAIDPTLFTSRFDFSILNTVTPPEEAAANQDANHPKDPT